MRRLFLVLAVFVCACKPLVEQDARFAGYNMSPDPVQTIVSGHGAGPEIPANSSKSFRVTVLVPSSTGAFSTEPVDQRTTVTVAFRNSRTGILTDVISCSAGAKVVTSVWYKVDSYGRGYPSCTST